MQCERAQLLLRESRYAEAQPNELAAHVASCAACSAFERREARLDRVLSQLTAAEPGPEFDARFFARLGRERVRVRRSYAPALWAMLPLAAAGALLWMQARPAPALSAQQELALARDLELVQNIEVVSKLDELEDYELLKQLDDTELSQLAETKP